MGSLIIIMPYPFIKINKYKMQGDCVLSWQKAIELTRIGSTGGEPAYNAVFTDHMMQGINGIETTNTIRALCLWVCAEYSNHTLTASTVYGIESIFYANEFSGFTGKPIDIRQLDSIVRNMGKKHTNW